MKVRLYDYGWDLVETIWLERVCGEEAAHAILPIIYEQDLEDKGYTLYDTACRRLLAVDVDASLLDGLSLEAAKELVKGRKIIKREIRGIFKKAGSVARDMWHQ